MKQLFIASGNAHKVAEFTRLLAGSGFMAHSAASCGGMPEVDENGGSFAANARIKAQALRALAPDEAWALADDSGLEVDALNGAPGVYSARYAGAGASDRENVEKLLHALESAKSPARAARFRCALCLIGPKGVMRSFEGTCEGRIARVPSGEEGFGYDPVFIPQGYEQSFGKLGETVKNRLSHRASAVREMRAALKLD